MSKDFFDLIRSDIITDPASLSMTNRGWEPIYTAAKDARIMIVGQAPGRVAQDTKKPWNDASGRLLRQWLDVSEEQFYDPNLIALVPMDFYYPGKGAHGDLPPRPGFAAKWHPKLLSHMPNIQLIILIGAYSQKYYLGKRARANLTETVRAYRDYLPEFFPLVHPSPLNFRWRSKNPWFEETVVPELSQLVKQIL